MQNSKVKYHKYIKDNVKILAVCKALGIDERQSGVVHRCKCPRHPDNHPSLTIYPDTNSYYCFQCGDSGDVFRFVMGYRKCNFHEALNWIEQSFPDLRGHRFTLADTVSADTDVNGYEIAWKVYSKMSSTEQQELEKFAIKRRYDSTYLSKCEIVYSAGRKLVNKFAKGDEYIEERYLLEEYALLTKVPRDVENKIALTDKYKDYYEKSRIIIPLRNYNRKLMGFAGRSVLGEDKPKYLFTKGLKKADFLYRLCNVAQSKKKELTKLFIVEGIFDTLRLEAKGQSAVAVLGSHLTEKQAKVLEKCVENAEITLSSICVFMDSDEAGLNGNFKTIKNLLRIPILRRCIISVRVIVNGCKDPDEYYAEHSIEDFEGVKEYSVFEYLFRFFLRNNENLLEKLDIEEEFRKKSSEERVQILNQIQNLLSYEDWKELFARLHAVREMEDTNDAPLKERVENYVLAKSTRHSIGYIEDVEYNYHMQNALQIVRTSYDREEIVLDEWTWDRIAASTDVFFPYLYDALRKHEGSLKLPLIRMMVPKKLNTQRPKSMYIHEQLLLQQYVMNELLSSGCDVQYENYIPAVRYSSVRKSYVTGRDYYQFFGQPVSFAYQIDMDVINGEHPAKVGMFRNFYDCWKDYIYYIQDGVTKLEGNAVYRVKLDIAGFYENISKSLVRDSLQQQLVEALRIDSKKFKCFQKESEVQNDSNETARETVDWILEQLFEERYYQPDTGKEAQKTDNSIGIPQGPNISAYIANIVLFPLDKKIQEKVSEINGKDEENHDFIKVRYCRYVDDMVIISSSPEYLLQLKDIIESVIYDMGFELSSKTDQEDGISKEEAIQWTIDERGGLGVSVGFDFPDDSMDSIMDDYIDIERTDRGTLLKLLKSILNVALYEGIPTGEDEFYALLKIVFQTEEIRLNDIVRFAELMLYEAAQKENFFDAYEDIWQKGLNDCVKDTLLLTEGLDVYVFLQGCERILKRLTKIQSDESGKLWSNTKNKIKLYFENDNNRKKLIEIVDKKDILRKNRKMILLQFARIDILIQKKSNIISDNDILYYERWIWCQERTNSEEIKYPQKIFSYIHWFHWTIIALSSAGKASAISNAFSNIKHNLMSNVDVNELNYLTYSMAIWSGGKTAQIPEVNPNIIRASLYTFLNILPQRFRAETIKKIDKYESLLFDSLDAVLAVFPGVNSPGIMALLKESQDSDFVIGARRCDFCETNDIIVDEPSKWEPTPILNFDNSEKNIKAYERKFESGKYRLSLCDYVNALKLNEPYDVLNAFYMLYPVIYKAIWKIRKKHPDKRMIFSQENIVLVLQSDERTIQSVELGITYLLEQNVAADVVAVKQEDGGFTLKGIDHYGAQFWIAGRLLQDVCKVDKYLIERSLGGTNAEDIEMLSYVVARLTGNYKGQYASAYRSDLSYQKSVDRTWRNLSEYLKQNQCKKIYLEDTKIINAFISYRMTFIHDISDQWGLAVWAKGYLCTHFKRLMEIADEFGDIRDEYKIDAKLQRRVPCWYSILGNRLFQVYETNNNLQGFRILAISLWADAILMNLRMQVLEYIQTLDEQTRNRYKTEYTELPLSCLGLEDSVKIIKQNRSWNLVWKNLLANVQDNNIKYLTHAGWVTFLAMLIEIDKTGPVLSGLDPQAWENAIEILHQLAELLNPIDEIKEDLRGDLKNEFEFPFEGMQNIYETWTPEKLQWISKQLNGLDEILDVKVELLDTQYFQMKVAKRDIIIHIDAEEYSKPLYFVTYSKKTSNGLDSFEISPADESKFRLSCTKKQNKILGISLIAKEFGERLSSWENSQTETASCVSNSNEDKPEKVVEERKRTDTAREACAEVEVTTIEKRVHNDDEEENNDLKNRIEWMHNGNWNKRKKAFKELDRIALFQFRIDSSYLPPEFEVEEDGKTMPDNLDSFSYAEYRRRQLLEPVLDACDKFDVEILLLPEYSVRPETVEWMCECLQEKKYTFSIWAGTFKIPAGYQFKTDYWREPKKETLNKRIYYHSAPLPVIMNDSNEDGSRNVCIIAKKVKKYPAVALQEEINPVPAINTAKGQESFRPIVDLVRDFPGIDINDDARKDVTELICAETFAVSNIVNYPSFFQISKETYRKYEKYSKIDETYEKSMVEDIMNPKLFTPKAK